MCKVKELVSNGYTELINELNRHRDCLNERLCEVQGTINNIHHELEIISFNGVQGYKILKYQQDLFKERREIKNEITRIDKIIPVLERSQAFADQSLDSMLNFQETFVKDTGVIKALL